MAKTRIMYIELKSNQNDMGPARICRVRFSKSGSSLHCGDKLLQRRNGVSGNYVDADSNEEYWISGPKKNGQDRHWAGSGQVEIDADVADEYWADIRGMKPPKNPLVA
jgi:hypothetical protein